ncbi:MAG: Phytoene dehydrogenase [Ignavibacteriae bacterium]|nr:MAG: Phytoene dehydrogenase [Ignavibacteriota bacterium]
MSKNVIIVGAGIGGLATALRLVKSGYKVKILEKNSQAGGRLNRISRDGFSFDTGPSFFSMSYEFENFAKDCRIRIPFKYSPLEPLYTVNIINNAKTFFIYKNVRKLSEQFNDIEPNFEIKMMKYLNKTEKVFNDTVDLVIKRNFDSIFSYLISLMQVNPIHLPLLLKSFWKEVTNNFSSREARQIISLVAFF